MVFDLTSPRESCQRRKPVPKTTLDTLSQPLRGKVAFFYDGLGMENVGFQLIS